MRKKPWKIIKDAYSDFQCAAVTGGLPGKWFNVTRGVHQGAPLSMPLYQVFTNELLCKLKATQYGAKVSDVNVTSPTHAYDMAIIALYKTGLNVLLKIAYEYSVKWNYTFNITKSIGMIWGLRSLPQHTHYVWFETPKCGARM